VNHSGDSDSTGAITGNLLGAMLGVEAITPEWLQPLELRAVIAEVAKEPSMSSRSGTLGSTRQTPISTDAFGEVPGVLKGQLQSSDSPALCSWPGPRGERSMTVLTLHRAVLYCTVT